MTTIIIIAVIALLILWVISVQRKLVKQDELCQNALSQIGVQQSSRWDALTALAELVKSYSEYEFNTLTKIIAERKSIGMNSSASEVDAQENVLKNLTTHINAVAEQYPELKASENYTKAMDSVNLYENQVRMSRMVYNDNVTALNRIVRQFPDSLVAGPLGFKQKEYLKVEEQKTQMPSMKI
jgi:LemA protein